MTIAEFKESLAANLNNMLTLDRENISHALMNTVVTDKSDLCDKHEVNLIATDAGYVYSAMSILGAAIRKALGDDEDVLVAYLDDNQNVEVFKWEPVSKFYNENPSS